MEDKKQSPYYCIFENKICPYAKKDGPTFECTAPNDESMPCMKA